MRGEPTYCIRRFYFRSQHPTRTIKTGLTLEKAKEHCADPETSSQRCSEDENVQHTHEFGPWFDGFEKE